MSTRKYKLKSNAPRLKPAVNRLSTGDNWRADKPGSTARGYGYRWQMERKDYLLDNPLCVMCQARGVITEACVVDHRIPHRGDMVLFWNRDNWQSLCKTCHSKHKQAQEFGH